MCNKNVKLFPEDIHYPELIYSKEKRRWGIYLTGSKLRTGIGENIPQGHWDVNMTTEELDKGETEAGTRGLQRYIDRRPVKVNSKGIRGLQMSYVLSLQER